MEDIRTNVCSVYVCILNNFCYYNSRLPMAQQPAIVILLLLRRLSIV